MTLKASFANQPPSCVDTIRVGILGCARIAHKNALAIGEVEGVEVDAVASRSLEKAVEFGTRYAIPKRYGSYEELLDDGSIDAVYIPLPTTIHLEWVREAAKRGLHILLEKPCAMNGDDLTEMLALCDKFGCFLMDGTMFLHHERFRSVLSKIEEKKFGPDGVSHLTTSFSFATDDSFFEENIRVKQNGDPLGCLGDLGWYCIRLALCCFEWKMPTYASAVVHQFAPGTKVPIDMSGTITWCEEKLDENSSLRKIPLVRSCNFHVSFTHARQQHVWLSGKTGILSMNDFVNPRSVEGAKWTEETDFLARMGLRGTEVSSTIQDFTSNSCRQESEMWVSFRDCCNAAKKGSQDRFWPGIALATQLVMDALFESAMSETAPGMKVSVDKKNLVNNFFTK